MSWLKRSWILIVLVIAFLFLQYKLWFSDNGIKQISELKQRLKLKQAKVEKTKIRNDQLLRQVRHVKNSSEEIEAHARYDLGMVKADEEYMQVVIPNSSTNNVATNNTVKSKQEDKGNHEDITE